ncbi:efflux RND transporter periplasmic adaptor subunit [Antarcticibacterium flavum]|uniref:Efflux RND transporter periplasmic adaptor subunit n=1 Tax=Antarcticibacterium flavum TaxID=2058175 RepID=A0A5B7X585_9FLAO|nr:MULTISPECIES: efflux RND transporter periplasmic adaptor subunit [Antarcticibacterium]MCM4159465.1 efflux RND transporter periplasmic adaptor subunit [Antarcticibacterium sp. W02-3]QCY69898.1 efflux RND transporter periplasmic adaptor subunit [Antarcticibacterium flavum]
MKKLLYISFLSILLISCGNSEENSVDEVIASQDLDQIRAKRVELSKEQRDLATKMEKLDAAINDLDPSLRLALVTTEIIRDTTFRHYTRVQGDVATRENIIIYPEFSGVLTRILVSEGDRVNRGDLLATIDDGGLSSQLAQLEAQAALAKTTYERQQRLWEQNIGSEIQFLEAQTTYQSAQNAVDQLRSQLGKTQVRAPFSGVIDEVISDEGQVVSPGQNQLFRLVNLKNMYVQASVPETYLNQIQVGSEVIVEISAIDKQYEGKVRQVGNFINPNNRTFQIEVSLPNDEGMIKPNLIATVKLNDYTAEDATVIPESAVYKNSMGESLIYVFKPENDSIGTAERVIIDTGYKQDNRVEVLEGIQSGDEVIVEGGRNLRDGQRVKLRN